MSDPPSQLELQVGGAVPLDTGVYVSRRTDAELLDALQHDEYCNVLCPRQMGKTSTILRIRAELRGRGYRTALIDIAGRLGTPPTAADWYLGLLSQVSLQFGLDRDVKAWWASRNEPTPNEKLLTFFRDEILGRESDRFVVFLDEIDHTLNLGYTDDFFLAIRSLYNDRAAEPDLRRLTFCLVGVFTPNELVKQRQTTTYNIGRTFELQDFDPERDDLTPLRRALPPGRDGGEVLLQAVLSWTGGQPYLTASTCRRVVDAGIDTAEAVDRLVEDCFVTHATQVEDSSDSIHFETIARFLKQRARKPIETAELYRRILRGDNERDRPTPPVVALKLSGLVKTDRRGRLVIRNQIYRRRFDMDWATIVLPLGDSSEGIHDEADRDDRLAISPPLFQARPLSEQVRKDLKAPADEPRRTVGKVFVSHSSMDDAIVRELHQALGEHGVSAWSDARELLPGGQLQRETQNAIDDAEAYALLISPHSLQSKWVGKELRYALDVRKRRGKDTFRIIPLLLDGTKLGVLEELFDDEPVSIPVSSAAGGVEAVMDALLVALGRRRPGDVTRAPKAAPQPLEELVLELSDVGFVEESGVRFASARARLVYEPATPGHAAVASADSWRFVAPLGPIEAHDLRWYLEEFAIWPSEGLRDRAHKVEEGLVKWGQLLHAAALPARQTASVMNAWAEKDGAVGRRFSVYVNAPLDAAAPTTDAATTRNATTLLLGMPWELLHDGDNFLFHGAKPARVRRRLPNRDPLDAPLAATPIRILIVSPRPEDDTCAFADHRTSALPLVEAMEALDGLVRVHVLTPATLPAFRGELERARRAGEPYHAVHFDGCRVYDRDRGLGAVCFEDPEDTVRLERRRSLRVFTSELGPLLRDHRVPLVFLHGSQTPGEVGTRSIASELLKTGVGSVVTLDQPVLVGTARRFVEAFYGALTRGLRVGDAMLEGQRLLKEDTFRGRIFGASELRLEDWFVPVLLQSQNDPQLVHSAPAPHAQHDPKTAPADRVGELPKEPAIGFVGRSRELLALERLLERDRFAVVHAQGGEGKSVLVAEFARWMVRSREIQRAAFVPLEMHSTRATVLDAIRRQLVPAPPAETSGDSESLHSVELALAGQSTLLVIDNVESLLPPSYAEIPEAAAEEGRHQLDAILALCARLIEQGDTRLVFTSREPLPAPFDGERQQLALRQLAPADAVRIVERALNHQAAGAGAVADASREAIEKLVAAGRGHARTLTLLASALRSRGAEATCTLLFELFAELKRAFPGNRELSVLAGVDLSLRHLSPASREKIPALGAFHGGVDLSVLRVMMEWEEEDVASLASELIETGLATPNRHNRLVLNPALPPYVRVRIADAQSDELTNRWRKATRSYVEYLDRQRIRHPDLAATLTVLELPNLLTLLEQSQRTQNREDVVELATSILRLLQPLDRPHLLAHLTHVREAAMTALGDAWNQAHFRALASTIDQHVADGRADEALAAATQLLDRARGASETAYPDAGRDLATAMFMMARALRAAGRSEHALPLLAEAQQRFEAMESQRDAVVAERMASACVTERADCLADLGRLEDAATAYEEAIRRDQRRGAERDVGVGRAQLGEVLLRLGRHREALQAYEEARALFEQLNEPRTVAAIADRTGRVYERTGQLEAAESAYRQSLALSVRIENTVGQAETLGQLANLYGQRHDGLEEAVQFGRQAIDKYRQIRDVAGEARARNNLAVTLHKLGRLDEARQEVERAIEGGEQVGQASEPWTSWAVLSAIHADARNVGAAAEAEEKATALYLAYRRNGGKNRSLPGRLAEVVTDQLRMGGSIAATAFLNDVAGDSALPGVLHPFVKALQAIVAGSRDRTIAHDSDLDYAMSAEILYLLDTIDADA